jgi:hypothetical protein
MTNVNVLVSIKPTGNPTAKPLECNVAGADSSQAVSGAMVAIVRMLRDSKCTRGKYDVTIQRPEKHQVETVTIDWPEWGKKLMQHVGIKSRGAK